MSETLRELADEYVIGLLGEDEARAVETRAEKDAELAAAIDDARDRFVEIDLAETPSAVPETVWNGVLSRLDAGENETVVPIGRARRVRTPVAAYWKQVAQAGIAACLLLAVGVGWMAMQPAPEFVAVLLDSDGEPQAVIEAFADDRVTVLPLENFDVPAGRTLQVWTKRNEPDAQPVSIGLMEQIRRLRLRGPDLPPPDEGQLYEITIEQEGGSPTGLPTGPIVGKGYAKHAI